MRSATPTLIQTMLRVALRAADTARTRCRDRRDHGEAFGERGFDGHAREVFRETPRSVHLSFPFKLEPGLTVSRSTQNVDIWPTLFELLGCAAGPTSTAARTARRSSRSRAARPRPRTGAPRSHTSTSPGVSPARSPSRSSPWSMVTIAMYASSRTRERPRTCSTAADDPDELHDVSEQQGDVRARLEKIATGYLAQKPAFGDAPAREVGELELNQLRALGYAIP
jgi:hypothetical protein